jgi:hypothetical protein
MNMKKLTMILISVLMVAGLSVSAFADPGWSNGKRYDHRGRYERPQYQNDHRDYREYRDRREYYRQPVIVNRVPMRQPESYVRIVPPPFPILTFFFPHMSIQIR